MPSGRVYDRNAAIAGFDMHAEIGEQILGVDHDVEQMRDRRPLVAADMADARLEQRFRDREDALAQKCLAGAKPERIHVFLEGAFHFPSGGLCFGRSHIAAFAEPHQARRPEGERPEG